MGSISKYSNAHYSFDVDVLGSSNKELWGDKLKNEVDGLMILLLIQTQEMK